MARRLPQSCMTFAENRQHLTLPVIPSRNVVTSIYVPRGGECASKAFPILRGRSNIAAADNQLDLSRRIVGRGYYGRRQGRLAPSPWSPGIVNNTTAYGRVLGSGIGSILSKGLTHVAKKGGQVIKKAATKHGTKIARQIKRRGTRLVKKQLDSTKRHVKRSLRRGVKDTRRHVARGVKRSITSSLNNLESKLKSTESSLRNKKRRRRQEGSSSSKRQRLAATVELPAVKKRRRRRRRRRHTGQSRKSFIGLNDKTWTGL